MTENNIVRLSYEQDCYQIEEGEPESKGSWRWRGIDGYTYTPKELFIEKNKYDFVDEINVDFDPRQHIEEPVYVVVVRYRTGNTFGKTSGMHQIIGAWLEKDELDELCHAINSRVDSESLRKIKNSPNFGYMKWRGFFEELEDVERYILTLKSDNASQGNGSWRVV